MKITIIVEGKTEKVFIPFLRELLRGRLQEKMPRLDPIPFNGRLPKEAKLKRVVENLFIGRNASDHVIALTNVYTGTKPPDFATAEQAKEKMRQWGGHDDRFHPHVALYDFEAWLLPYWSTIQKLAKHNQNAPHGHPESINHNKPPSYYIRDIFERGQCRDSYNKIRDARRVLRDNDLMVSVRICSELKALMNTILKICDADTIK